MSLPVTGQLNWGIPLNTYIQTVVLAAAQSAQTSVNNHVTGTDPHGDRAYAAGLVAPINSGVNGPSGFVKLNSGGIIPANLLPVGSVKTTFWDVKRDFGAAGNGTTDDTAAVQAALTAATNASGGEVWVPSGTYKITAQLFIGPNTWLHLSPGAVMLRGTPVVGSAPSIMIANVQFVPNAPTSNSNILISGGGWDATGNFTLTSACQPIYILGSWFTEITQTQVNGVAGSPLITLDGTSYCIIRDVVLTGAALSSPGSVPAIRLNSTTSGVTPAGLSSGAYTNRTCGNILVEATALAWSGNSTYPPVSRLLGTDLYSGHPHSTVTITANSVASYSNLSYPMVDPTHISNCQVFGNQFPSSFSTAAASTTQLATNINGGNWEICAVSFYADGQTDYEFFAQWGSVNDGSAGGGSNYPGGPQYQLWLDGTRLTWYYNGPVGTFPNSGAPQMAGGMIFYTTLGTGNTPSQGNHTIALFIQPWTGTTTDVQGPVQIYARPVPVTFGS